MSKPKSLTNLRAGKALQRLRIENATMEQDLLAVACGWKENRIRDREISVASITLVEVVRLGLVYNLDPIIVAKRFIAPIAISLDKVTVNNTDIGIWIKHGKLGDRKTWAKSIIEKKFPGDWVIYEDYKDAILYTTDTIDEIRRQTEDDLRNGLIKPTELVNTAHLGRDWEIEQMKAQGANLKGFRLKKGYASQWVAASKTGFNSSWQQVRESAKVSIKLEDCVAIAEAWDTSPFTLVEILLNPVPPTEGDLKALRRRYC